MKRLQIMLDEDLDAELARRASTEGRSKASIIRESLRQTLRPLPPLEEDPIWEMVGADPGGEPVEDIDEYLIGLKEAKMRDAK
ncbi:MAG TPA: CopG family transcriptional regulator [Thermoleophilaceae bacterium]|nr:CopG family transcriptional regulator [Thermoleophilaceae bacterium]